MLEVCVDSLTSAINAVRGGADELEVCSSLTEGGLTPSVGLVKMVRGMIKNEWNKSADNQYDVKTKIKAPTVNVMIRCRAGSDFHYSKEEMDTMLCDIESFKDIGVDRFVFGALTNTQDIDEINCTKVIETALPIPVTFHRAFDICNNPQKAVLKIIDIGFNRLLTSGQKPSADNLEALQLIDDLNKAYGDKIEIMPGAGVNVENVKKFINIGCKIVHSSCKRIKVLPKVENGVNMGTNESEHIFVTDVEICRRMKHNLLYFEVEQ